MDTARDGSTNLPFPARPGSPTSNSPHTSTTKMGFGVISNCCRAKCKNASAQAKQHILMPFPHTAHHLLLLPGSFNDMLHTLPLPTSFHHLPHHTSDHLPCLWQSCPSPPEHVPARLTKTLMASCRGPEVFRLSLPCSTVYSHSKPISMNTWLLASLPLAFRMKFPVA